MAIRDESLARSAKDGERMTDIAAAQDILHKSFPINGNRNVKRAIGEAFDAIQRIERRLPREVLNKRPRIWTERRVKSLWKGEARRVDHYEITDLEQVQLEQARAEYRKVTADLRRLEAVLAAHGAGRMGTEAPR